MPLIQIIDKAQQSGIRLNTPRLAEVQHILQTRLEAIILEARALTHDNKFNIGGQKQLKEILYSKEM